MGVPKLPIHRLCKKCNRYVSAENLHCDKCNACTSKVRHPHAYSVVSPFINPLAHRMAEGMYTVTSATSV